MKGLKRKGKKGGGGEREGEKAKEEGGMRRKKEYQSAHALTRVNNITQIYKIQHHVSWEGKRERDSEGKDV